MILKQSVTEREETVRYNFDCWIVWFEILQLRQFFMLMVSVFPVAYKKGPQIYLMWKWNIILFMIYLQTVKLRKVSEKCEKLQSSEDSLKVKNAELLNSIKIREDECLRIAEEKEQASDWKYPNSTYIQKSNFLPYATYLLLWDHSLIIIHLLIQLWGLWHEAMSNIKSLLEYKVSRYFSS